MFCWDNNFPLPYSLSQSAIETICYIIFLGACNFFRPPPHRTLFEHDEARVGIRVKFLCNIFLPHKVIMPK